MADGYLFDHSPIAGTRPSARQHTPWSSPSPEQHRLGMLRTKEEFHETQYPDSADPNVRADMVFFETPAGGAVFSVGSISFAGALATDDYDNDIARMTGNVFERFADPTPFEYPVSTR